VVVSDILECPPDQNDDPILKLDEQNEVDKEPEKPCKIPSEMPSADVCDGSVASDDRKDTLVEISKRLWVTLSFQAITDYSSYITALLSSNGGKTGKGFCVLPLAV